MQNYLTADNLTVGYRGKPILSDISMNIRRGSIVTLIGPNGAGKSTILKWVMSSNSVAVMPRPKYESWFMEGRLQPGVHYIEIKDDYSDLEDKIQYYSTHVEEAEAIIRNAHAFVEQFRDKEREELISILVLEKYLRHTKQ